MNQNILHGGMDVDDARRHGSAFNQQTDEVANFKCRPTLKDSRTHPDKLQRHFRSCSRLSGEVLGGLNVNRP